MIRLQTIQTRITDDLHEAQLSHVEKKRRQLYATYLNSKESSKTREQAYEQWKTITYQYIEISAEIWEKISLKTQDHFNIGPELLKESLCYLMDETSNELDTRERQEYKEEYQRQEAIYKKEKMQNKPVISKDLCKKILKRNLDATEQFYEYLQQFIGTAQFLERYNLIEKELADSLYVRDGVSCEELNYWTMHYKLTESENVRTWYN